MDSADDSSRNVGHDAGPLGEAWRRFAQEDAAVAAPPRLERRVIAAWETLRQRQPRTDRPLPTRLVWALGAIAGAFVIAVASHGHRETTIPSAPDSGAVITLAIDPVLETETLQVVRVRMPRPAVQAVGVALSGPDTEGFVDLDVVVGEDGLPRAVRRVALSQK